MTTIPIQFLVVLILTTVFIITEQDLPDWMKAAFFIIIFLIGSVEIL